MSDPIWDPDPERRAGADGYLSYFCPLCGTSTCIQAPSEWLLDQGIAAHDAAVHALPIRGIS